MLSSQQSAHIPSTSIVFLQMLSMEAVAVQFAESNGRSFHFEVPCLLNYLKEMQGLIQLIGTKTEAI
jgi:hypothetical protein